MSEQHKETNSPVLENSEDQKYKEVHTTMDEESRIMKEIDNIFANTPDRAEAERAILENSAPLLDEAMKKSGEALHAWTDSMRELDK